MASTDASTKLADLPSEVLTDILFRSIVDEAKRQTKLDEEGDIPYHLCPAKEGLARCRFGVAIACKQLYREAYRPAAHLFEEWTDQHCCCTMCYRCRCSPPWDNERCCRYHLYEQRMQMSPWKSPAGSPLWSDDDVCVYDMRLM